MKYSYIKLFMNGFLLMLGLILSPLHFHPKATDQKPNITVKQNGLKINYRYTLTN